VVATRSGGVPAAVLHETTGVLLEPGDVEGQARALMTLAGDHLLRARLGAAARKRAMECFSMEQEHGRFLRILGLDGQ